MVNRRSTPRSQPPDCRFLIKFDPPAKIAVNKKFRPASGQVVGSLKESVMRQYFPFVAFSLTLLVSGADFARGATLENIPLKWTPTSALSEWGPVDVSGAMITAKIHVETFVDTRQNPTLIAENREKADKVRQVTTSSDVAGFVTDHLKESLHGAGLNTVDGDADINISGEIRQFFVTEMSTYNGEISLLIHVKNRGGKELWSGVVTGDASRWGRSYSAANYYETISNMVLSATHNLLANTGFHEAVAH
jgi:hypothetical protein